MRSGLQNPEDKILVRLICNMKGSNKTPLLVHFVNLVKIFGTWFIASRAHM